MEQDATLRDLELRTSLRPVRGLLAVPVHDDLEWQISMVAALRTQALMWGGQANLIAPLVDGFDEHPAFVAIAQAADPDAILVHPGSWADVADLEPEVYSKWEAGLRVQLNDYPAETRESFVAESASRAWGDGWDGKQFSTILRQLGLLQHGGEPEMGFAVASEPPSWPWVDARVLQPETEQTMTDVRCESDQDVQLILAMKFGQLPALSEGTTAEAGAAVTREVVTDANAVARDLYGRQADESPQGRPFDLSMRGCGWFAPVGMRVDHVPVVVGDSPWDFAVAYALDRMLGCAHWIPPRLLDDPVLASYIARSHHPRRADKVVITSVSKPEEVGSVVARLSEFSPDAGASLEQAEYGGLFRDEARRLLCSAVPQKVARVQVGSTQRVPIEPRVPSVRAKNDPFDLQWMCDVSVSGWSTITDSELAAAVVEGPSIGLHSARTTSDGVSLLCPRGLVMQGIELEAQVPTSDIKCLSVVDQVAAIGAQSDYSCQPSDKGVYSLQAAELLGGMPALMGLVSESEWLTLLRALASDKKTEHPGRWSRSDQRRYFDLAALRGLLEKTSLGISPRDLVDRGIVWRGLSHSCPTCRFTSWFDQAELANALRCARCRQTISLTGRGWDGDDEPRWIYRLDEVLWQFINHHSDLALRGIHQVLAQDGARDGSWGLGVEMEIRSPSGNTFGETDLTLVRSGSLWIGEAKSNANLGANADKSLKRLLKAARHLRADGVLLVSEGKPFPEGQQELAREIFDDPWLQLRIECVAA